MKLVIGKIVHFGTNFCRLKFHAPRASRIEWLHVESDALNLFGIWAVGDLLVHFSLRKGRKHL